MLPFVSAYNATLAPAKKVFIVERGEKIEYSITYTNNSGPLDRFFQVSVGDFYYSEGGALSFLPIEELGQPLQSLTSWTKVPELVEAGDGKSVEIPVSITVPQHADFGDHMGAVFIEAAELDDAKGVVGVKGRLASLVILKVTGGEVVRKSGIVERFDITSREKARNTVTFEYQFLNTGREFFDLETIVDVYDQLSDQRPLKTLTHSIAVFPNARKNIYIPLGDLGDDYGEKEYFARVLIQERAEGSDRVVFSQLQKPFYYSVPIQHAAAPQVEVIEKEVVVTPSVVEIVKELGLYVGAFLVVLLVLIRVLFFSRGGVVPRGRRKR